MKVILIGVDYSENFWFAENHIDIKLRIYSPKIKTVNLFKDLLLAQEPFFISFHLPTRKKGKIT